MHFFKGKFQFYVNCIAKHKMVDSARAAHAETQFLTAAEDSLSIWTTSWDLCQRREQGFPFERHVHTQWLPRKS